jgi:magnesium transporter
VTEALVYSDEAVEHRAADDAADLRAARDAAGTTWVRASGSDIDTVAEAFGLHALTVEDVRGHARPKTEEFADYTFLLVKDADLRRGDQTFEEEIDDQPVGLYIGDRWLVTLSLGPVPAVETVWERALSGDERLLHRGPDFAAYRILDLLVDEYFAVLDQVETQIEAIEEAVLESTAIDTLEGINAARRDLLAFRKIAWPTREAVNTFARGRPEQVNAETEKYFRDVYDHLAQAVDLTETYRDLTAGARDIYLNTVAQSTNEVTKALTVVATIFIPLTFIAGVYGMNFAGGPFAMPELGWSYGYPAVMLGMAIVGVVLLYSFRKRGWI